MPNPWSGIGRAAISNYPLMPEMQMPNIPGTEMQFPGMIPGQNMQQSYDLLRNMTTLNPAMDLAGLATGGMAKPIASGLGKVGGMMGRMAGKYGDELAELFGRGRSNYSQGGPPPGPFGGGQAALGPDEMLPNPGAPSRGQGGLAGQEAASGYPTMPMEPPPSSFAPDQMPPPLGGQGPMDVMADNTLRGPSWARGDVPPPQQTAFGAMEGGPRNPLDQSISLMGTSQPPLGGMPPEANQLITDAVNSGMSVEQAVEWVMQMYQGMGG